jgi:hypothetical protein
MWQRSPETTAAGLLAAVGVLTFLLGVIFAQSEAITAGLGMIGAASTALGLLSRSERQHEKDRDQGQT